MDNTPPSIQGRRQSPRAKLIAMMEPSTAAPSPNSTPESAAPRNYLSLQDHRRWQHSPQPDMAGNIGDIYLSHNLFPPYAPGAPLSGYDFTYDSDVETMPVAPLPYYQQNWRPDTGHLYQGSQDQQSFMPMTEISQEPVYYDDPSASTNGAFVLDLAGFQDPHNGSGHEELARSQLGDEELGSFGDRLRRESSAEQDSSKHISPDANIDPDLLLEDEIPKPARKPRKKKQDKAPKVQKPAPLLKAHGLCFDNLEEARRLVQGLDWPPREDDSLPETDPERVAIALDLVDAMQDLSDVKDKIDGASLIHRWLGIPTEDPEDAAGAEGEAKQRTATDEYYSLPSKHRVCLELVNITERLYREGAGFISILDPGKLKDCEKWRHLTFGERIAKLTQVCRQYKSRVDKLLRNRGYWEEYVLCPNTLIKISDSNRSINDRRMGDITAGRKRADRPMSTKQSRKAVEVATPTPGKDTSTPATVEEVGEKRTREDYEDEFDNSAGPSVKRSRNA